MSALAVTTSTSFTKFQEAVAATIQSMPAFSNPLQESNWLNPVWKSICAQVDRDVLVGAWETQETLKNLFKSLGEIQWRPSPKTEKRFNEKIQEANKCKEGTQIPERPERVFQALSDLTAARISVDNLEEIQPKLSAIQSIVTNQNGCSFIRGTAPDSKFGYYKNKEGSYIDITQFIYVFIPVTGCLTEIQVGHPFAALTFEIDSKLREDKQCGLVKLWTDGFYKDVRTYILNQANGIQQAPNARQLILEKAERIHPNGVPEQLQKILNNL